MIKVTITGIDAMAAKIKALDLAMQQREMTAVARVGGEILQRDMQARVAQDSGDLRDDIQVRDRRSALLHEGIVRVGPGPKTDWRAKFLERGTSPHLIARKRKKVLYNAATETFFGPAVKHRGSMARPFIRPALESNRERVHQAMRQAIQNLIMKVTR